MSGTAPVDATGTLPVGWAETTIGGVAGLNPAKPRADAVPANTPVTFVPMPAVDADAGAITAASQRPFAEVRKGFTSFKDEDVIVAKITPCFENGKAAICRGLTNGLGFGSTEFHVLRSTGAVLPEYLYHFVRRESLRRDGESNMTGSVGQKRVPADWLSNVSFPLAPLAEQARIVAKVDGVLARVNAARERLAKVPKFLKRFRQSILAAACSGRLTADWRDQHRHVEPVEQAFLRLSNQRRAEYEKAVAVARSNGERAPRKPHYLQEIEEDGIDLPAIPELPESWKLLHVQDTAVIMQYGTSVKADAPADTGVPMLRMGNVQDGRIDLSDLKYMARDADDVNSFLLHSGDIMFNRTNSPELVGKSAVFGEDREAVFASYLVRLKCDSRFVQSDYVCNWINSLWGRAWARAVRTDGVSQSNINATKLGAMPLPVPPLEEQKVIGERVRQMFALADKIEAKVAAGTMRAEKVVKATLAKAFRGELVQTEAELAEQEGREYETAASLLERISQVRATDGTVITPHQRRRMVATTAQSNGQPRGTLFDAGVPFSGDGRAAGTTQGSEATSALPEAQTRSQPPESGSGEDRVEISYDDAMGYVRNAFAEGGARDREQAVKDVTVALGYERVGSRVRDTVDGYLRTAVRRGILIHENGQYSLLVRSAADYTREHLIDRLVAALNGGWVEREVAVRATAKHLGWQKAGSAFRAEMKSAINGAIRRGLLEYDGKLIRKA